MIGMQYKIMIWRLLDKG
ncbi:Protein of unknown function [Bacillus cytotoxicus]|nr:Protein of unknown function [Bacillus cytotoxicus]